MGVTTYCADVSPLYDGAAYEEYRSLLPRYRREKADRFVFQKDRALSVGAGTLLMRAMDEFGISGSEPSYGPNGKPSFPGSGFSYNLSHSGTKVICSVSESDVGCDVEQVTDIDLEIARRYFFNTEYRDISACPDPVTRNEMFFRFWTLKESFMKVTGRGFSLPLDEFCIHIGDEVIVDQRVDARSYFFREFDLHDGYRYACCSVDPDIGCEMKAVRFL